MKVAVYQHRGAIRDPGRQLASLAATADRLSGSVDLLLCPELFLSGYNIGAAAIAELAETIPGRSASTICKIARNAGMAVVCGFPERDGPRVYNAALCIDDKGEVLACHRKLYLPNSYEREAFTPGDRFTIFSFKGMKVGVLICFDVEFPEAVRGLAVRGAELVVVPTALKVEWAWLATSMTQIRAFENGVYLAYANHAGTEGGWRYCGSSCIVGPDGQDRARAGSGEEVITAEIDRADIAKARQTLPYLQVLRHDIA